MGDLTKILTQMNTNPKGVRFNELWKYVNISSGSHAKVEAVIAYLRRPGLEILV